MAALSEQELDALVEEAIVDAYDEDEQRSGFRVMIEDNLNLPFLTTVLGVEVTVTAIVDAPGTGIAAVCRMGAFEQLIGVLDVPLPSPLPAGAEWIEAYRHWAR